MVEVQRRAEAVRIILFATGAAIVYGVLHDQVTAHLCVEYFTVAHPPVFPTASPFLLALGWGVIATWWVGLPLGLALATAARLGHRRKLGVRDLGRPVLTLMLVSALCAFAGGVMGAVLVARGWPGALMGWERIIPPDRHAVFAAALWAHTMSYAAGIIGGVIVIGHTIWRRVRA